MHNSMEISSRNHRILNRGSGALARDRIWWRSTYPMLMKLIQSGSFSRWFLYNSSGCNSRTSCIGYEETWVHVGISLWMYSNIESLAMSNGRQCCEASSGMSEGDWPSSLLMNSAPKGTLPATTMNMHTSPLVHPAIKTCSVATGTRPWHSIIKKLVKLL